MNQPTLSDDEIRALVTQVRTAQHWTNAHIQTRLRTRPDGRLAAAPLVTTLTRGSNLSQALANTLTQLPHLMREALATEPTRPWTLLLTHNTRALESEIETVMTALAQAALGRAKLRRVFEIAATMLHEETESLEQAQGAQATRFQQVQRTHREVVHDLQGYRLGWLAFLINLFKGDALTRLVETCNERESLALEMDVHQATASLLAQAAYAAQQRAVALNTKAEALERVARTLQTELDALKTRLQTKLPFLTHGVDNWRVTNEYARAQIDGTLPSSLLAGLADTATPVTASIEFIQAEAARWATTQTHALDVQAALEVEAKQLGIPLEDETLHPLVLVGEALLRECLEAQPRFWLTALAHPREFLFQVTADSATPFELADSYVAKFEAGKGTHGWLGLVHVQLGLTREDLDVYTQTCGAFQIAQNDHNLFVVEELAKHWNRRWRKRERRMLNTKKTATVNTPQ